MSKCILLFSLSFEFIQAAEQEGYSVEVSTINELHNSTINDRVLVTSMQAAISDLQRRSEAVTNNNRISTPPTIPSPPNRNRARRNNGPATQQYCCKHGWCVSHSSQEFQSPDPGHQQAASTTNTMNGRIRGYKKTFGVDPPQGLEYNRQQWQKFQRHE